MEKLIIFDMDGVLVDTSKSYDEAVRQTIKIVAPKVPDVTKDMIEQTRMKGGFNDDWKLTQELLRSSGVTLSLDDIIPVFQKCYLGESMNGLITNERWLLEKSTLKQLSGSYNLAIFTDRPRKEAEFALKQNAVGEYFCQLVAREDVTRNKPDPEGLLTLVKKWTPKTTWYVGDSIDDALSAAYANVQFIGIMPPGCINTEKHCTDLLGQGAVSYLENINQIQGALPHAP